MMELNDKGLYDGYGMWHQPFWQTNQFLLFFGVVILLFLAFCIYKGVRFYQKRWKVRMAPWQKALRDLNNLKRSCDYRQDSGKQFYYELSFIFKVYLRQRYGFDFLGKTDQEIICYLKSQGALREVHDQLAIILNGAQKIKFANHTALEEVIARDFNMSVSIIKSTMPQEKKDAQA